MESQNLPIIPIKMNDIPLIAGYSTEKRAHIIAQQVYVTVNPEQLSGRPGSSGEGIVKKVDIVSGKPVYPPFKDRYSR
jgi:hypothetical protein